MWRINGTPLASRVMSSILAPTFHLFGRMNVIIPYDRIYSISKNLPQSNQLLSASRVNRHAAIKVLLGSAHLHSNTEALEHLANTKAKNVQTNHLLLRTSADDLHLGRVLGLFLGRHHAIVHGGELGVVDLDLVVAVPLASLRLGETD